MFRPASPKLLTGTANALTLNHRFTVGLSSSGLPTRLGRVRLVTPTLAGSPLKSADAHRKIYQAIRARDADGARIAMDEHIRVAALTLAKEEGS